MRKGTLTVKLKFKVLPDGLSGQSVAGEPVFPASIAQGNTFEVDISPICDTRKAEVKYSLVSNSLESVTDTAKIYIPASLDAYNIAFKRKLVQSIIYCATERERVWATIDYEATRLFTGIVDLSNLTIQSYSYQGDIELTLKDNGYLLDEKIARSIELPVQAFPRFNSASSPKTKGVYYKDPDNANAFYFWNGSAWAHKESFSDTESKYFHPDATVRVWSSAVVGGELVESVVGALLGMAGYSVSGGTIDPSASDTSTSVVRCFTYDMSEDKTYKEVLDTLLKEYRMCLTFTPEGKVRIVSLSHTSIHATRDIGYGLKGTLGRRDGIKTTFEASKKDGVKLKYSSGLAVRREQSIYSENLGSEFDENGELKGTAIKPQQCLPETGDITATYQEYNAKFLDRAYTTKVNRKENEDLSIISTHGHHLEVAQKGGTLTYPAFTVGESAEHGTGANPYFMPKKAQVLFRNDYEMKNKDPDSTEYGEEAESHSIYLQIFNIVADVLYRDKTTTIYAPSATANPETYESTYLFDDGPARAFANFYLGWNQYGAMKTDWTEYKGTVDTIGSIIGYQHTDSAISSYCFLSEETISFTGSPDVPFVIKMHGIGIAPYNDKPVQSVSYMGDNKNRGANGATGPKGETGATGTSIIGIVEEYALSSSSSSVTGSWGTAVPTLSPTDKYLWNRSKTKYSDGTTSAYTTAVVIGVYGDTGKAMTYMYASAPEGLYPGGCPFGTDQNVIGMADTAIGIDYEWHDTVPDIADGYVLWTKTTAPDGTVSIYRVQGPKGEPGETGPQGPTGATGATGRGISGITEYYLASASSTAPSASDTGWSTSAQTPTTAKPYLWNKTVVTYTSGSPTTTIAMIGQSIKGNPGATGATGNGIKSVTVSYGVSASPSTQPTSWQNTVPAVSEGQYLWTRTITDYTDDSVADTVTYTYAKQGETGGTGATGATGNGIRSIANHYLATSASSGVTTSTSGWSTTVQAMTETNKYLWNYETIAYTNGTSVNSTPCVIGVYGSKGNPGSPGTSVTISSIKYQAGASATTAPTGTWSDNPVSVSQGQYLWTKTTFSDGKIAYGVARQGADGAKGDPGETGSSAKDFTLYQSATYFEVSPRGVTHKMQVISITCVPLNLTSPTITWSVSSAVPTQAISSDKTVLSLTVQSGVALSDMTVACAVSGIGTKTIKILATPVGEDGPIYLGTDWDESATTTSEGDPLKSGDYYLRLSDTMVRVYSGTEWRDVSTATSTHKMMQDALSDVLKHGADVKSTSSVLYAYVGNLVAQSASIKRLSTEVITSANYAETNGSPATGYKLDGPNDKIKTVGMIASEGIFRNVNISGGSMSIFNANNQTVFKTADRTATANVIDISVPSGNSFYSLKRIIDSMATKPATESPDYKKLRTDAATIEGVSFDGIVYQTAGKRRTIILGHDLQCDSRTGALKYSNFAETPTHTIVKGSDGYYGIKECHIDIYGVDTIFCTLGRGGNKWNGKNAYIMLYSSSGVLLKSATSSYAGYIALEYGGVIPVGSYAVAYVDSESYGLYYDWYFESRFPELAPEFGYGILFFNADATSESNYYRLVNTYSNTPFTISKIRGSAVSVSTADYLTALPVADIISMIATTGTYISVDSTSSTYSSTDQTQVSLSELIVTRNMLSLQPINGTNIVLSVGDVVDNPVIHFEVIGEREGIAVSNINAINEYGEIATSGLMFANIWTDKIDNINVCDSDNQVLSTSSQSIVGAINELKSDFGVRYPIFHGSLCPPSTPLLEIGEIPVFTATSLTKYRYFCVSGYMDSGAENMPETHRFVLFDANGNTTKLGRIFLNITLQEQLVITGISYGPSGDANAFLGGLVVQFNAENYLHKMTCSQYGRIIVSGTAIQSWTQYTIKDIWLE